MQNTSLVDKLNKFEHFESNHDASFEREFAIAPVEHIFKRFSQIVHDHYIIIPLSSYIVDLWDVDFFSYFLGLDELSDEFRLIKELGAFG